MISFDRFQDISTKYIYLKTTVWIHMITMLLLLLLLHRNYRVLILSSVHQGGREREWRMIYMSILSM